jgi:hypothetical protein
MAAKRRITAVAVGKSFIRPRMERETPLCERQGRYCSSTAELRLAVPAVVTANDTADLEAA